MVLQVVGATVAIPEVVGRGPVIPEIEHQAVEGRLADIAQEGIAARTAFNPEPVAGNPAEVVALEGAHATDAIVVSNHGGRQLDGALSSIRILPSIVRAVKGQTEIWIDSGIRSGQDVLKALALGADAAMIGRSYIYGLGAMGEAGVTRALDIIRKELDVTLALCGERDVKNLGAHNLLVPRDFEGDWA